MTTVDALSISSSLLSKAIEFGADLVGFAAVEDLKMAPSFTFAPLIEVADERIGKNDTGLAPGEALWPGKANTVMVIAVSHPEDKPEMDWWYGQKDPPGNRILSKTVQELCSWIPKQFGVDVFHFPYCVEKGGTYLKDAAVLAGLGCIGKNNILVTPEYGPRVRLRAMILDVELPSTGPSGFNPCAMCSELCRKACPQKAFSKKLYFAADYGQEVLPGRDGTYARSSCSNQMTIDEDTEEQKVDGLEKPVKIIKYCRRCEFSCPVGKITN